MSWAPVTTCRETVWRLLDGAPVTVSRFLPGTPDDLPRFVVGRPGVTEGDIAGTAQVTVPVFALGRTVRDVDAQTELDDLGDVLAARFWNPPRVEGMSMRMTDLSAGVIEIGGVDVPAYTASVVVIVTNCP